jgi:hypothetical protein
MDVTTMNCCACQEINYISDCDTAEEAMLEFAEHNGKYLSAFYIFTGLIKNGRNVDPGGKVCQGFAKIIEDNELGELVESPAKPNRLNHPTHKVKIWIWMPNRKKLAAWFKKNVTKEYLERERPYGY